MNSKLYFECHVTIEPVFDEQLQLVKELAASTTFRVAELLMKKRVEDTETRSKYDTFMTATNKNYEILERDMLSLIGKLRTADIKVWRYKIEDTVIDSRINDIHGALYAH